jgi:SulP family sulfate permease
MALDGRPSLGHGFREALREGMNRQKLVRDLAAGSVVGVIAIPLSMALAIATDVPPQHGLYTAIVAGAVVALLGGSRTQITGPTAAFVAILVPIVHLHGLGGLLLATMMAGMLLCIMALAGMGRLIEYVPYPVISGFTAGIAIVIATLQLKDFLGLQIHEMPESFLERALVIGRAMDTIHLPDLAVGAVTLSLLVLFPKIVRSIPAPLLVLPLVAVAAALLHAGWPEFAPATIYTRFHYDTPAGPAGGIPQALPPFLFPWQEPGPGGTPIGLSLSLIRALLPAAFAIAMLAAIESLLSAVIADGMTGHRHNPDAELLALGLANIACSFFGGFAATGAVARTAANIRFGGRSPIAALTHSAVVLAAVVALAPALGYLPTAALAALLMLVAWNMSEARHVLFVARIAPKSDTFVLVSCLLLTVVFDMVIAVSAGMLIAAALFIRRMSEVTSTTLHSHETHAHLSGLPGVLVYEIGGPLFFGASQKAMANIEFIDPNVKTVIFDFSEVPALDITGLINLESAVHKLRAKGIQVVLAGVEEQPLRALHKAEWTSRFAEVPVFARFEDAMALVRPALAQDRAMTESFIGR